MKLVSGIVRGRGSADGAPGTTSDTIFTFFAVFCLFCIYFPGLAVTAAYTRKQEKQHARSSAIYVTGDADQRSRQPGCESGGILQSFAV